MAKYAVVRYPRCFCFSWEYLIRYVSLIRFQASKNTTVLCSLVRILMSQTLDLTALQYVEKEGVSLPVLCSLCHVGGEAHKMSTLAIMRWEIVSLHRPAKKRLKTVAGGLLLFAFFMTFQSISLSQSARSGHSFPFWGEIIRRWEVRTSV